MIGFSNFNNELHNKYPRATPTPKKINEKKMNKKKSPDNNEVLKDIDDYDDEPEPLEKRPKKKGIFNFWR